MASSHAAGQMHVKGSPADGHDESTLPVSRAEPGAGAQAASDLPRELAEAGWRRFWSKRENRWYYFNKFTNQALWELPTVTAGLAIQASDATTTNAAVSPLSPTFVASPAGPITGRSANGNSLARRRSHSIERGDGGPAKKTFTFTSPSWNLEIPSNAVIRERSMSRLFPPHPDIELLRAQLVARLRQQYHEMCHSRLGIEPPPESFNRWLLERKLADEGGDPLLPTKCPSGLSGSLASELMECLPLRIARPPLGGDVRRHLSRYAEAAQRLVETSKASADTRKVVKWNVEEMFQWLRSHPMASYEDCMERLSHMRKQCQPHIDDILRDSVESLCQRLSQLSAEDAVKIRGRQRELWTSLGLAAVSPAACLTSRLIGCYPTLLAQPGPRLPDPELSADGGGEHTVLKYKGEALHVSTPYYYKLEQLYRWNCKDDPRMDNFEARVFCLLRRYQSFFGIHKYEGVAVQTSLPVPVFECLNRVFGVTFEWFASPLNCYYKQFCSAFPDTDGYFGSRGTFLEFSPVSGSFEAHPPFCGEVVDAMADHFERLLSGTQEALSIVVFVPEPGSTEPPLRGAEKLCTSRFNRKQITLPASEHAYTHGLQHVCSRDQLNSASRHATTLTVLQNDSGYDRWQPTEDRMRDLVASFAPRTHPA